MAESFSNRLNVAMAFRNVKQIDFFCFLLGNFLTVYAEYIIMKLQLLRGHFIYMKGVFP